MAKARAAVRRKRTARTTAMGEERLLDQATTEAVAGGPRKGKRPAEEQEVVSGLLRRAARLYCRP